MRSSAPVIAFLAVAALLRASAACNDGDVPPCRVDTDCPQSEICRDERCGPVGVDGGAVPDSNVSPSCALEGTICALNEECCSSSCIGGRCAPDTPPPGSGGGCRGLYEQCSSGTDDCCDGLTCESSVCR